MGIIVISYTCLRLVYSKTMSERKMESSEINPKSGRSKISTHDRISQSMWLDIAIFCPKSVQYPLKSHTIHQEIPKLKPP